MLTGVIQLIRGSEQELSNFRLKMESHTLVGSGDRRLGFRDGCYHGVEAYGAPLGQTNSHH